MRSTVRLDQLLVKRGFFESRSRAQWAIREGLVRVNGTVVEKAGSMITETVCLEVDDHPSFRYVGFGGYKLETALRDFYLSPRGLHVMDVGSSTGGFTDCLLQQGAVRVAAVDVGTGQLHPRLRQDPRVLYFEKTDIRNLNVFYRAALMTVDVSFISVTHILSALQNFLDDDGYLLILIKPQFEQEVRMKFRNGIIRNPEIVAAAVRRVVEAAENEGFYVRDVTLAPLDEEKNIEVFALFRPFGPGFKERVVAKTLHLLRPESQGSRSQIKPYYPPGHPKAVLR
ncbi:MAG: TlyA family RNA methyltransferase [Flavobacteriales bacterium]|nr:TlyA family RNA methyltransferase [Flavobacteriales bacterium]